MEAKIQEAMSLHAQIEIIQLTLTPVQRELYKALHVAMGEVGHASGAESIEDTEELVEGVEKFLEAVKASVAITKMLESK